jgi:hypothetical protein
MNNENFVWYNGVLSPFSDAMGNRMIAVISGSYETKEECEKHLIDDQNFAEENYSKYVNPFSTWVYFRLKKDRVIITARNVEKGKRPTNLLAGEVLKKSAIFGKRNKV